MKKEQVEVCKKILQEEIRILSPRFVVFLTSGWENIFIKHLSKDLESKWDKPRKWGSKYETKVCTVSDTVYICSPHPQGKNEYHHFKAITDIIKTKMLSEANE